MIRNSKHIQLTYYTIPKKREKKWTMAACLSTLLSMQCGPVYSVLHIHTPVT